MLKPDSTTEEVIVGVHVTRNPRDVKRLRVRVLSPEGRVVLSVPRGTPPTVVTSFVSKHREWILQTVQRMRAPQPTPLTDGNTVAILGQECIVRIAEGQRSNARLVDGVVDLRCPGGDHDAAARALDRLRHRELSTLVARLIKRWEPLVGRSAGCVRYRTMTTRWGSCNHATGAMTFNLLLAQRSPDLIEYVVVHELVHLREANHGPKFQAWMNLLLPDWKDRRRQLREVP